MKFNMKSTLCCILVISVLCSILMGCSPKKEETISSMSEDSTSDSPQGEIYLYGEIHDMPSILQEELAIWKSFYHEEDMRHLFVELPYYTAAYLNLWMEAEDDTILEQLYRDWAGTSQHSEDVLEFYRTIKQDCPETIFHGTDLGHQYDTTGARYLAYLEEQDLEESEAYEITQEVIRQGKTFYKTDNPVYRENTMVENFCRAFDALEEKRIMGIYGAAHTVIDGLDFSNSVPCMANQLHEIYGDLVHAEDLSQLDVPEPDFETIEVNGTAYPATYFGYQNTRSFLEEYQYRQYYRLENAYDDFKDAPTVQNVLPYNNYPTEMEIEVGQVFVIDYTTYEGAVERKFFRSDGKYWNDMPITQEFLPNP